MSGRRPTWPACACWAPRCAAPNSGSQTLKDATNEAIRDWIANPVDTHYIIGSVVGPHPYPDLVARLQAVISEEMRTQLLEKTGTELPDFVVACVGGGSNAAGAFYHFLDEPSVRLMAVEAAGHGINSGHSAATSVLGTPGIIHGSRTLLMQDEHGQITEPYSLSAGLDYPGIGPAARPPGRSRPRPSSLPSPTTKPWRP